LARYTGSVCRLCRRENLKLFLKGDRCFSAKCGFDRRGYAPGQHGQRRVKFSIHGIQLREKQKVKRMYGLLEKQFRIAFQKADRQKGITGTNLLVLLERRLDIFFFTFFLERVFLIAIVSFLIYYFLMLPFFLTAVRLGPFRVRAFVLVLCPRTGSDLR